MSALLVALVGCGSMTPNGGGSGHAGKDGPSCPPDVAVFEENVWKPVLAANCVVCHGLGGIGAEGSRLKLDPNDLQASMEATYTVGDRLLLKPTGQAKDGHGGGTVVAAGTQAYDALAFWVGWTGGESCEAPAAVACDQQDEGRLLRRLTHAEYDRTVSDLLGVEVDAESGFAADPVVDGFRNDAASLVVSDLLADQYQQAAEEAAAAADRKALLPCDPAVVGDAACAAAFVEDFGYRAFRRPLTQDDIDRYVALWTSVATDDGFDAGIQWVITAMLQSPHFLYRSELGVQGDPGRFALTSWELATNLSYTLWGTTPDEALLTKAANGDLDTPDGLAATAAEMMADPRALETAADEAEVWLDTSQLATVSRDGLTPELRAAMKQETRDLVEDVASRGGTLTDLMSARYTFVDPELAAHYGLDGSGKVDLDGLRYGGLLTQGSVLTTHGRPDGSGPVQRGVTVRERLLCEDLPPPPSNLNVSPPPVDPTLSTRDRYEQHTTDPVCAGCHDQIDPLGFGFEHYDQLGRYRDDDGGLAIDDSGQLDAVAFQGPFELADALLADPRFRSCFVSTWRRHATGVPACGDDRGADVGLLDPLAEVPTRASFAVRVGGPDELDTLAVGTRVVPEDPGTIDVPEGDVALALEVTSDWGAGWCANGTVTNGSSETVTWSVRSPVDGTVTSIWNANYVVDGADWVFTGIAGNDDTIAAGGTASFGLCANR